MVSVRWEPLAPPSRLCCCRRWVTSKIVGSTFLPMLCTKGQWLVLLDIQQDRLCTQWQVWRHSQGPTTGRGLCMHRGSTLQ